MVMDWLVWSALAAGTLAVGLGGWVMWFIAQLDRNEP